MSNPKQNALDRLLSKFPKRYKVSQTKYLNAIVDALAEGDAYVETQVEATRDNMLVVTASGNYLDRLASLYGIVRDTATGVSDDDFKKLIPLLGNSKKQIFHSLQSIIDIIYGPYASHANTTCSAPAPYDLSSNNNLTVSVDGVLIPLTFKSSDASNIHAATALEVANAFTEHTSGKIIGSVISNTRTGEQFVNLRTKTIGQQGFIQVTGGDAQAAMRFPQIRPTRQGIATWNVTRFQGSDEMVYLATSGISPGARTAGVRTGDYVTIRHDSGFLSENTGSYRVTFADENSFRLANGSGLPESNITQHHLDDFCFFRPDLGNVLLSSRPATVLQTGARELTVILPVTSPIVKRSLRGGHHFHGSLAVVNAVTSNSMTIGTTNGFNPSGDVHVVGSREINAGVCSSVGSGTINLVSAEGWPSSGSAYSPVHQTFYYYSGRTANALTGVVPAPPTSIVGSPMFYSQRYSYTSVLGNTLQGVYPDPTPSLGQEVTSSIILNPMFYGSFLYDKSSTFVASVNSTVLTETIQQGSNKTVAQVGDVSSFNEAGYFVLEYATDAQEGPIKYFGKVGTQALIIDPGHVFTRDHLAGTSIRMLRQVGTYIPRTNGDDYAVYLTGTSAARTLVAGYLADIIAAGVTIKFQIQVPDQHWPVLPLLHSTNPLDTQLATFG